MKTILAALFALCGLTPALAQDPDDLAPEFAGPLVFENEAVAVVRIAIAPHRRTPMHALPARVVVWLSDAHFVDRLPKGDSGEEQRRPGDVEWVPARRHAGENLADTPMEFIAVVPKERRGGGGGDHRAPGAFVL